MIECVPPESVGLSAPRLSRISDWLKQQVDQQRLAGASVLVGRYGSHAFFDTAGFAEVETGKVFDVNTLVRIYSMTKPVTTVAAMMLYEQGHFQLDDPIAIYLPEFRNTPVWDGGKAGLDSVHPQKTPITVRHLMTHTAGLTYDFMHSNVVDEHYREAGLNMPGARESLESLVKRLAQAPLICQPGSQWNYSVASDVLGRLVEVWSGQSLAQYFENHIFQPLGMNDTGFFVPPEKAERFAALYGPQSGADMSSVGKTSSPGIAPPKPTGIKLLEASAGSRFLKDPQLFSGGGGLVGSITDYARFCQMLLSGGELDGQRLLGRKTVEYMRINHLPDDQDMAAMGQPVWSETSYDGIGFGLGFAVVLDPAKAQIITSPGEHHWGGAASTFFWLDPEEDIYAVMFTQLMPSSTWPIRRELRTRVYQAIVD
ncbi:MAG: serine hydrolase domain-containing protein [Burkholderiaceae bacterium]